MATKQVICKSGLKGSEDRLQDRYDSFEEWKRFAEMYGLIERLEGQESSADPDDKAKEWWDRNPVLQSSTNPDDFREVEWNELAERLKDRLKADIECLLGTIRDCLVKKGHACTEVEFWDGDDYSWHVRVTPQTKDMDRQEMVPVGCKDIDLTIGIVESKECEDSEDGIAFRMDVVADGGEILGQLCPYNYTPELWVDIYDDEAVNERWELFSGCADCNEIETIVDNYAKGKQ
jgi:hypothetical protein